MQAGSLVVVPVCAAASRRLLFLFGVTHKKLFNGQFVSEARGKALALSPPPRGLGRESQSVTEEVRRHGEDLGRHSEKFAGLALTPGRASRSGQRHEAEEGRRRGAARRPGGAPAARDRPGARRVLDRRHGGGQRHLHRPQRGSDEQRQRGPLAAGVDALRGAFLVW